ncbi:ATP-binding protein [Streptomyces sp. NPDC056716]|uniref:ATP-binding protein n=1 Tax=unclassified Streptomyces TaxID=2593676 RepID=UPI0036A25566
MSAGTAPPSHSADPGMTEVHHRLSRSPRSAGRARALLRGQLTEWNIDGEASQVAELLLSELVTNALLHAQVPTGREIGLRFTRYDGRLRVEVADANNDRPEVRAATVEDEHGRGLALVEALADRWGYCPRPYGIGKATWAEVTLTPDA